MYDGQASLHRDVHVFHSARDYRESCIPYRVPGESQARLTLCTYTDTMDPGISHEVRMHKEWEPELSLEFFNELKKADGKVGG